MSIETRLTELGIILPPPPIAIGAYLPVVQTGNMLYVSGQLPLFENRVTFRGKVGREVPLEEGVEAARLCTVNALAAVTQAIGNLDRVQQIVRVEVFVNSAPGFDQQADVANGASNLLHDLFGHQGRHARIAVGAAELPKEAAVELALILAITP